MAFDPFGDFSTRGYLRNTVKAKNPADIATFEHQAFMSKMGVAIAALREKPTLTYQDILDTHKTLFQDFYPWAGQDRSQTAPNIAITKAGRSDMFAHPADVQRASKYGLSQGLNPKLMREQPGTILGSLAHAHPFLEGNGRTIMIVHGELARRADMHIDWTATDTEGFLTALTRELVSPGKALDAYLKPFVREGALELSAMESMLRVLRGLNPRNEITDKTSPLPFREFRADKGHA